MSRIAILTPWFGDECTGGAETLARELAGRLASGDTVTVLTTTSRSFLHEWGVDYHKPGLTREGNYSVLRFRVAPRNADAFAAINEHLLALPKERWYEIEASDDDLDAFIDESINSPDLEQHLRRDAGASYDAVLALPYLYGVVVRGIEACSAPVHLIPCLHDEAYARLPRIETAFHRARTLLFNSSGEAELALRLYGPGLPAKSVVIGSGIAPATPAGEPVPLGGAYYLYLGRREPEKGVERLIEAFGRYRSNGASHDTVLALAGPGTRSYDDPGAGIHDLGLVDEATKTTLLRGAVALLNPSRNESYSRVVMEAWREEVPVVVEAGCLATALPVQESRGGLLAETQDEWISALRTLDEMPPSERKRIGSLGAAYASQHADWDKAVARLRAAIGRSESEARAANGKRIDQLVEAFDVGDAISDDARGIRHRLRELGYASEIFAANRAPGVDDAQPLPAALERADALIYHHSIGSDVAETFIGAAGRKAVVYHNVTPSRFFAPYLPDVAAQLERGREQLPRIAAACDVCVGASDFNSAEMRALGAREVRTIPPATDFRRFDVTPRPLILRTKRGTTWLYVGRVAPNKGLEALIAAFEVFLALDEDAALIIAGKFDKGHRYYNALKAQLAERHIEPYVLFTGYARDPEMVAYYRSADVFVSMSEHEGFCVPLVEAMFFDVPIVAKATAAVPGTLGTAGVLLETGADAYEVAATVYEVCNDRRLRDQIIAAQRERRRAFMPAAIEPLIDALAKDLVASV